VLTGETGAGKSILVDALQLVLGSRADATVVREGPRAPNFSRVRLPAPLAAWLAEHGFEALDALLLRRAIDATRAKAAPGSTAAPPPPRSCARRAHGWSTFTASMPGKA
jgi:DNA repair ATPase RecN